MKHYTLTAAQSFDHTPEQPERTARRARTGFLDFDVDFQVWPNRKSMAKTIRMQQQREYRPGDWVPVVRLKDGEGYQ